MSVILVLVLSIAACGPGATEAPPAEEPTEAPAEEPTEEPTEEPVPAEKVQIRWFVGLGTGGQPEHIEAQNQVVEEFNASQDEIELVIEIVDNEVAYDQLSTQIASGSPPDIVGPVGVRGSNAFSGLWLDLAPLVESAGYDLTQFDEAAVNFYKVEGEGQIGLPFAVFPSAIFYNKDLFDEAGLDYPPHKVGETYADGDAWTVEKLEELALILTVDANGNDATSPDFDEDNIEQFGFAEQWSAATRMATLFGAGSLVAPDGETAQMPDHWRTAFKWYYDGMWKKRFIPTENYASSDMLGNGNVFNSGNVAMAKTHLWYICCLGDVENWDVAVNPEYEGEMTSPLHADTFRIMKGTKHPEEAFTVLTYLLGDGAPTLLDAYGAFPARKAQQADFFEGLDERFPQGVDWQVFVDSLSHPDIPSHEANMPNFQEADDRVGAFWTLIASEGTLDIDAEIDKLVNDLQVIFDKAED
jgi:multiple sugar transport system substrate-binding protein